MLFTDEKTGKHQNASSPVTVSELSLEIEFAGIIEEFHDKLE